MHNFYLLDKESNTNIATIQPKIDKIPNAQSDTINEATTKINETTKSGMFREDYLKQFI